MQPACCRDAIVWPALVLEEALSDLRHVLRDLPGLAIKHQLAVAKQVSCIEGAALLLAIQAPSLGDARADKYLNADKYFALLIMIGTQVVNAMVFLSEHQVVHRDLAARNVLVCSHQPMLVKLADFGSKNVVRSFNRHLSILDCFRF